VKLAPAPPLAGKQQVRNDGAEKKHGGDQTLGEHCQRQQRIGREDARRPAIMQSGQKQIEGQGDQQRQDRFRDENSGE
jgi:hypothetical protein